MAARDAWIREHHVATVLASEQKLALRATPIESQQSVTIRTAIGVSGTDGAHRRRYRAGEPGTPPSRSSKAEIPDQPDRIDQVCPKELVKPAGESFLAQQPVRVRGVERARDPLSRHSVSKHRPILARPKSLVYAVGLSPLAMIVETRWGTSRWTAWPAPATATTSTSASRDDIWSAISRNF